MCVFSAIDVAADCITPGVPDGKGPPTTMVGVGCRVREGSYFDPQELETSVSGITTTRQPPDVDLKSRKICRRLEKHTNLSVK